MDNSMPPSVDASLHFVSTTSHPSGLGQNNTKTQPAWNEASAEEPYDLICIGFGPASLAIAVALHDCGINARVLFLERQQQFAWHAGMLLPSVRMQISFLKDLATFRDPRSYFTFLNYLKCQNRLEAFTNLSTFLPLREEFNDYLTWAAGHFEDSVRYGSEALSITPSLEDGKLVESWTVAFKDLNTGETDTLPARHVIIAMGGKPKLPRPLQKLGLKVVHSSQYLTAVPKLLPSDKSNMRLAVVGGGQSAAEIFDDLTSQFPQAKTSLFTAGSALKPSDDSPFVNEIFDSANVTSFYDLPDPLRQSVIADNRATNYSVVRPALLDKLYEKLYHQRLQSASEESWLHRIVPLRELSSAEQDSDGRVNLSFKNPWSGETFREEGWDLVVVGTGYVRDGHRWLLDPVRERGLLDDHGKVERNYSVKTRDGKVGKECGLWLQGCCEESHGLSDTLLSILAVRAGELVESIFGNRGTQNGEKVKVNGVMTGKNGVEEGMNGIRTGRSGVLKGTNGH